MRLKKRLGQHLLMDSRPLARIARAVAAEPDDTILEIGPGTGNLTERLLETSARVVAVELDPEMCDRLRDRFAGESRLEILREDILKTDLPALARRVSPDRPLIVAGNLPYYITTPIILRLLDHPGLFSAVVVLLQQEVAERVAAVPGGREYGALSLACQSRARCAVVARVPRTAFRPPPQVDSAVVRMDLLPPPDHGIEDFTAFERVVRGAFEHRRKTCYNALRFSLGKGPEALTDDVLREAFTRAGISPDVRPQTLSIANFARLTVEIVRIGGALNRHGDQT